MTEFLFTPYSIEAFKRIARDIQKAYPLALQQSQEVLARAFGYADFHAVQKHLKTGPVPGPCGPGADSAAITAEDNFLKVVLERHGTAALQTKGRMQIQHLCLTGDPERRKQAMDLEAQMDRILEDDIPAESAPPAAQD